MNDIVKVAFSGMTLFTIIFVQQGIRESLFNDSLNFIPRIQEGASEFKQKAWDVYSNLGLTLITTIPMFIPYYFIE